MILEKFEFGKERLQIFVADPGFEENSIRSLDEFASKLSKSVLVPSWNTPRQTGNREILREILGGKPFHIRRTQEWNAPLHQQSHHSWLLLQLEFQSFRS